MKFKKSDTKNNTDTHRMKMTKIMTALECQERIKKWSKFQGNT